MESEVSGGVLLREEVIRRPREKGRRERKERGRESNLIDRPGDASGSCSDVT